MAIWEHMYFWPGTQWRGPHGAVGTGAGTGTDERLCSIHQSTLKLDSLSWPCRFQVNVALVQILPCLLLTDSVVTGFRT